MLLLSGCRIGTCGRRCSLYEPSGPMGPWRCSKPRAMPHWLRCCTLSGCSGHVLGILLLIVVPVKGPCCILIRCPSAFATSEPRCWWTLWPGTLLVYLAGLQSGTFCPRPLQHREDLGSIDCQATPLQLAQGVCNGVFAASVLRESVDLRLQAIVRDTGSGHTTYDMRRWYFLRHLWCVQLHADKAAQWSMSGPPCQSRVGRPAQEAVGRGAPDQMYLVGCGG